VVGALDEHALLDAYARARVAIAPLRFGAGVKGKVLEAMRLGVPCVATPVGAQGLDDARCLAVSSDPAAMAADIARLCSVDDAWMQASRDGQAFIRERFTPQAVWDVIADVVDETPYPDVATRLAGCSAPSSRP
jgi:glycosyltransferase involved in cell wall biosynthesis